MPKVSIQFKRPKGLAAIILYYKCDDGYLKYYTGESAVDKTPDKATQAVISKMISEVNQTASDFKITEKSLTKRALKEILDKRFRKQNSAGATGLMTEVIDKMQKGEILTPDKKKYSPGSIKSFRHTIRLLDEFLDGDEITIDTYKRFIVWCQEKNFSTNYIGSQIKNWKSLGRQATQNPVYSLFKKIQEETFDIALNEQEIEKIYRLELTSRFDLVRDWFILDCYTGLRVSDLTLLIKKNYSDGFITIANEKTDKKVVIPAHPFVKEIFKKYKGFPQKISDQEINRCIKVIAKKAGIKEKVLFTITKGGKRVDEYLSKWQMVSAHTCRRSFITNLLKSGVSETMIMKLTEIKSHATLKRYTKITHEEVAKIMKDHSFFK